MATLQISFHGFDNESAEPWLHGPNPEQIMVIYVQRHSRPCMTKAASVGKIGRADNGFPERGCARFNPNYTVRGHFCPEFADAKLKLP